MDGEHKKCPKCGGNLDIYDSEEYLTYMANCEECGWADDRDYYEAKNGDVVLITREEAIKLEFISSCECGNDMAWWQKEDHGCCVTCWHKRNKIDN